MLRGFEGILELEDRPSKGIYLNKPGNYTVEIDVCKYKDKSENPQHKGAIFFIAETTLTSSTTEDYPVGSKVSIVKNLTKNAFEMRDAAQFMAAATGESSIDNVKDETFLSAVVGEEQLLSGKSVRIIVTPKDGYSEGFTVAEYSPV